VNLHDLLHYVLNDLGPSLRSVGPELSLCAAIMLVLLARMIVPARKFAWLPYAIALAGTLVGLYFLGQEILSWLNRSAGVPYVQGPPPQSIFTGLLVRDSFGIAIRGLLLFFAVLFVTFTRVSGVPGEDDAVEFYVMVLGATLGMCIMVTANHALMVVLGIEMASVPSYVLAGILRHRRTSSEAALKYAVFGAAAAGVMLYGISLLTGVLGTAHLPTMAERLSDWLRPREVHANVDGQVIEIGKDVSGKPIEQGSSVKKDQVLFRLDNPKLSVRAADIDGQVDVEREHYNALQHEITANGSALKPDERARLTLQLDESQNKLRGLEQQAQRFKSELADLEVRSPIDGRIETWDIANRLANRPVHRGDLLLQVTKDGPDFRATAIVLVLGGLMTMVGLAFKLSAVPFHFWVPDVFEGAPAEVGMFLSIASKAAAVALLTRLALIFSGGGLDPVKATATIAALAPVRFYLSSLIALLSAVTCTFGNLAAYGQTNIKRLLAYSTIAHAGYMMMPVAAAVKLSGDVSHPQREGAVQAVAALVVYLGVYLFMNFGAFAIVAFVRNASRSESIGDYAGMVRRSTAVAVSLAIILFSLVGLPPLAGFSAKFAAFAALLDANMYLLLVIGGLNTVLSLFYYLRVVKVMTLEAEPEQHPAPAIPLLSAPGIYSAVLAGTMVIIFIRWGGLWTIGQVAGRALVQWTTRQ
jgi:NADH:ubiquinone oxidoreductase subunit 2 (subunit N)